MIYISWIIEEFFYIKKFFCFLAEEFIFMVNFDEIEFLESEIVEDDDTAPVGTLIRRAEDGSVEEVTLPILEEENNDDASLDVLEETTAEQEEPVQEEKVEEPVEDVAEPTEEPAEELVEEANAVVEPVEEHTEAVEEPVAAVEEQVEQDTLVAEDTQVEEVVQEEVSSLETLIEENNAEQESVATPVQEEPIAEEKPVKKAKSVVSNNDTEIHISDGFSVNDALFDTNFDIEKPTKAKVVSTKKKQEKAEDLWAVAPVVQKKEASALEEDKNVKKATNTKTVKTTSEPKAEDTVKATESKPKSTAKKATKAVDNTKNTTTEENIKVAKAADKTVKTEAPATKEEKAPKAKATKTATKDGKVEKAPKAAPAKEAKETKAVKDNEETVLVEGEGRMHGKYVIKKTDKGNFVFKLYSSNYRVVAIGAQAYTTLGAAKIGIQSVINNAEKAPVENQTLKNYEVLKFPKWEIYLDKKGEYRLRLFATNGSLIATTNDGYADISGAKNGIAAVGRASKGCAIVRNDNLW